MAKKAARKAEKKTVGGRVRKSPKASAARKSPAKTRVAAGPGRGVGASSRARAPARARKSKPAVKVAAAEIAVVPAASAPVRPSTPARDFAISVARTCADDHCENVVVLDVTGMSSMTDYIVIGSGTSDRQMRSVLRHCEELGHASRFDAVRTSGDERATWLVADFVDVTLHLFEPSTRTHYDLEMLWGDAPRVEWERSDQLPRDRAGLARSGAGRASPGAGRDD